MKPTIFLAFAPAARALYYGDEAIAALRALGEVRVNDHAQALSGASLIDAARDCQVIVADRATEGRADLFERSPDLAVFLRCAVDIRNIDVQAASTSGVLVTQASAGFVNAVAEWALGAMIAMARGFGASLSAYRSGARPDVTMGRELRGATLGIIGYGRIGRRLGEIGNALGMRVVASDPEASPSDDAMTRLPLNALLAEADFVVCLAPALEQTENLMDSARFARMKPGAFFINASRGSLVDEAALLGALDSGRLAGAALDVGRAPDQMPTPTLARHPRVLATPHIGGLTPTATSHQALETVAQLRTLLAGEIPVGAVNPTHATRLAKLRAA